MHPLPQDGLAPDRRITGGPPDDTQGRVGRRTFISAAAIALLATARPSAAWADGPPLWPTGSTAVPYISDGYGYRGDIGLNTNPFHHGVDIPIPADTPLKGAVSGQVVFSGWLIGETVVIQSGAVQFLYAHMKSGTRRGLGAINQGDTVGLCGLTGQTTGYHTCFRVFVNGNYSTNAGSVDPVLFMQNYQTVPAEAEPEEGNYPLMRSVLDPRDNRWWAIGNGDPQPFGNNYLENGVYVNAAVIYFQSVWGPGITGMSTQGFLDAILASTPLTSPKRPAVSLTATAAQRAAAGQAIVNASLADMVA